MPKPKCCQLSGARKRHLANEKANKTRTAIASARRLDRYIVHSKLKVITLSDFESKKMLLLVRLVLLKQAIFKITNYSQIQDR